MSKFCRLLIPFLGLIAVSTIHASPQRHALHAAYLGTGHALKPGQLDYAFFYDMQTLLQSYQPHEPRLLDLKLQALYTEMTEPQRDAYMPSGAGVDILSRTVDVKLPMEKGGYFVLPSLTTAYNEGAAISFEKKSKDNIVNIAWALRVGPNHRLSYGAVQQALAEVRTIQGKIPFHFAQFQPIKLSVYSGIKACFSDLGGQVLIGGKPVEDAAVGDCTVVKLDKMTARPDDVIEFSGPLDIVTVVDTRVYAP